MPPLSLVVLGGVDVIKCSRLQVIAPAVAVGHDILAVVVTLIDRVGIESRGGDAGPQAVLLQIGPLRRAVLLPAERPQRRTAPRERPMSPEVRLGHVAVPILRQLLGQELGLDGIGYRMIFGAPIGFKVLHIVLVAGDDLGKLLVTPPSGESVSGLFDKNPVTGFLSLGGDVLERDPAGRNGSGHDARQGHENNYESRDTA